MADLPRAANESWFASQMPGTDRRADFGIGMSVCDVCAKPIMNRGCKQCEKSFCLECFNAHTDTCEGTAVDQSNNEDDVQIPRGSSDSWFSSPQFPSMLRLRASSDGTSNGGQASAPQRSTENWLSPQLPGVIDNRDDFGAGMSVCDLCAKPVMNRGCKQCDKRFCPEHFISHKDACKGPQLELKQKLKGHFEDTMWFREFMSLVVAEKVSRGATQESEELDEGLTLSAQNKGFSRSFPCTQGSPSDMVEQETRVLVTKAQTKWQRMCEDLRRGETNQANLREACEALDRQCEAHRASAHVIVQTIETMQAGAHERLSLKESEVARDQIVARTIAIHKELLGLNKRMAALEAPIGSVASSSSSVVSRLGASFTLTTSSTEGRRSRTCINRDSSCTLS